MVLLSVTQHRPGLEARRKEADKPPHRCGYFFVRCMVLLFMGEPCGAAKAAPVSFFPVFQPARSRPPVWKRGLRGLRLAKKEAIMPKTMYRALRALFPIQSHPIANASSLAEARQLGARLVSAGARVVIHRSKSGFIVRGVA